ncbi:MAG TPA: flagellar filament capping protein FliD [Methylotenera sp.]|nr:flagellar filament capping protein FliD [Methylotenera sp.]
MAITAGGVGSGLDIEGLVRQLVAAEGQPAIQRLDRKEANLQGDLSAFGSLKSALNAFLDSVKALQNQNDFLKRRAVSSNTELFSATANQNAVSGQYDIQVQQLAQAAKVRSTDFTSADAVVGSGSLEIAIGGANNFTVNIAEGNNTLAGVRDAINAADDNSGITATIINVDGGSRLVLTSNKAGLGNDISIVANNTGVDGDLTQLNTANLVSLQSAQSAIFLVDQQSVTRDSNSISDVIDGITFDLKKAEPGTTGTLTVSQDNASVKTKVNAFVEAYNALNQTMRQLASYDAETERAGPLLGDAALRGVQSQLRQTISGAVEGLGVSTLAELGITTNKDTGGLTLETAKLDAVLASDFSAVANIFASENGLSNKLANVLERYAGSDGILDNRTSGLRSRIDTIDSDRERLADRLSAVEARYRAQFTAMDILVAQLSTIGNFLGQQLANLPKPKSN